MRGDADRPGAPRSCRRSLSSSVAQPTIRKLIHCLCLTLEGSESRSLASEKQEEAERVRSNLDQPNAHTQRIVVIQKIKLFYLVFTGENTK